MASLYSNTDPYSEPSDADTPVMVLASKNGIWDTVWSILDKKPYLVNSIPKERAWAILHQAVWWKNINAVERILQIPGCDSELLTKNGLRPLDIETTVGIQQLIKKHINSNELSKSSFFLTLEELAEPADEIPCNMSDEELDEKEPQKTKEIHEAAKKRNWKTMFKILKIWGHLINLVNPETGLAPIHEAAIDGNDKAVIELMSYTACDPLVKTKKPAKVGHGKTAAEITASQAVKSAIHWNLNESKKKYTTAPTCVDPGTAQLNLMWYVHEAILNNSICDKTYDSKYYRSFPDMEEGIFNFINVINNWESARDSVVKEIKRIDAAKIEAIQNTNSKDAFFQSLIHLYTTEYYSRLNKCLREHPTSLPDVVTKSDKSYRVYTALINALLFYGDFNGLKKQCTEVTYRGMELSSKDLQQYTKVGNKFSWIPFTSSSIEEKSRFPGNCLFIFNNKTKCQWSPRGIKDISEYENEHEYLYPCGAYFEVTKFKKQINHNDKNHIYLKLIDLPKVLKPFELIYDKTKLNYDNLVLEYNKVYCPIIAQRRLVDEANERLHELHSEMGRNRNYKKEAAEHKVSKINLPKGETAYHCRDCNTTCDYPCPESHMYLERCRFCIPCAEGACTKCRGKCYFKRHTKTNFKIHEEVVNRTVIDVPMRTKYEAAETNYRSQNVEYQTLKLNWETNFHKFPKATQLITKMTESTQQLANILGVNDDNAWDNWDDTVIQFSECRSFVEECRFEMSQLGLM
ncbi:hypothetical protein LOD99_3358 [Oopsacas minuta]|uniref:NAD(P)(+)--arginine ADP-ribosyltransferase n=1 Tax=Oopsacas minuta TaxID=111878 RepID=A0AAV7JY73_9METZ|nr:hypothetical protein LOD99_3358 [Oopsacas minuta]